MAAEFTIISISWERLYLSLRVESDCSEPVSFRFENTKTSKKIPLEHDTDKSGLFYICVNLSTAEPKKFIGNGSWTLAAYNGSFSSQCIVSEDCAGRFDELSRVFRYSKANYAFTADFGVRTSSSESLLFVMRTAFMKRNDNWKKRRYYENTSSLRSRIKGFSKYIYQKMTGFLYFISRKFSKKTGRNILFMSDTHSVIGGNLKAIDERMKLRGLDKEYNISYYFVRTVKGRFRRIAERAGQIRMIAKQDFIFVDDVAPSLLNFRIDPKVVLVQVWHGGGGFKAVGYCRFGKDGSPNPDDSFHRQYTYALAPSESLRDVFQEVFGIGREDIIASGMPRTDSYPDEKKAEEFRQSFFSSFPQLLGKKIILFAPTFRGRGISNAYYDFKMTDFGRIYDFCGDEYVFAVRMHPFVKNKFDITEEQKSRIYDFSSFPDINELFYVTDILITDYSSCYYEFSLHKKPILFYTYDRVHYEITRGVYQDVKSSAPGKVCDTFEELMQALEDKDYEYEKTAAFAGADSADSAGHASDTVIDKIILGRD